MQLYGIIGYPLIHSRSPEYFNELFRREGMDARYLPFEMEDISVLPHLLQTHPELCGLNVTIPHKQSILPYMDVLSDEAAAIGAVNCLRVERDNGMQRLYGYNTDATGFRRALLEFMPRPAGKALILGDGGAARAVRYVLHALGMETVTASRCPQGEGRIAYNQVVSCLPSCALIVNATPLGTFPHDDTCPPIPYELLTSQHYLFDLVYNPATTLFMKHGQAAGAHACNGYAMWRYQAEENRRIWMNDEG